MSVTIHNIILTEAGTHRKLYINLDSISHWFDATNLDTGELGAIIYLRNSTIYCTKENAEHILQLINV